jgi:hypothetical protein
MISPLYGQLSPLRVPTSMRRVSDDNDANAYLLAVESADGQQLESGVISAVEAFILGCKSDGIWGAIKASCILAGARTLSGALVPLVGTAPTNNNFVSGDYNRETGLKGNGTNKYLNPQRTDSADPQNSHHYSVWVTTAPTLNANRGYIGNAAGTGSNNYVISQSGATVFFYNRNGGLQLTSQGSTTGLKGTSRSSSTAWAIRSGGVTTSGNLVVSVAPTGSTIIVFGRGVGSFSDARLSFYSIGEHLPLAALDTRVSTLMTALAAAIP